MLINSERTSERTILAFKIYRSRPAGKGVGSMVFEGFMERLLTAGVGVNKVSRRRNEARACFESVRQDFEAQDSRHLFQLIPSRSQVTSTPFARGFPPGGIP